MALNDAVPSSATDVFKRNAEDTDRLLNATGNITTRTGKILPSWDEITKTHAAWNNRGAWVTATAYAIGDIWSNTVTNTWYLVLNAYTSGATVNDDIAGPNVTVLQGAKYGTFEGLSDAVAFVTTHPELFPDNTAVSTSSYRTQSECTTLGIDYPDGGGADYVVVPAGAGILGFWDAGTKQLKLNPNNPSRISAAVFGFVKDPTYNNWASVNDATEFALSTNRRFVDIEGDTLVAGDVPNKANVVYIGDGKFLGEVDSDLIKIGIYRRQIVQETAKRARAYPDNIQEVKVPDPSNVTVVFFGDSLTTYEANSTSSNNTKSAHFEKMLRASNPDTNFTFHNRAIGGQGSDDMNSKPPTVDPIYGWYTDVNRDWLEYVYDLNPDVVVMATGMNENSSFEPQNIYEIKEKIEANTSAAIVFVADYLPTISPVGINEGSSFAWYVAQEWRDRAAGFVRSYANYIGYPLIDLNRTFSMLRDGIDILSQTYIKKDDGFLMQDGQLTVNQKGICRAWTLKAEFIAGAFTNANPVSISLDEGSKHIAWLQDDGGFLRLRVYETGGAASPVRFYDTGLPTPAGNNVYEIVVDLTSFSIRDVTGGQPYARFEIPLIKLGGLYRPVVDYFAQPSGPIVGTPEFYQGVAVSVMPTVLDYEFFGVVESGFENETTGGDGKVHPSSLGLEALHGEHYSNQNLIIQGRDNATIVTQVTDQGAVSFDYKKERGGRFTVSGSTITNASGVVSITLPFAANKSLRDLSVVSAWGFAGVYHSASVDSSTTNNTTLSVITQDASGVAIGNKSFSFNITGY